MFFLIIQTGNGHHGVAGNVSKGLPYIYCPQRPPEPAALFPDPGKLVTPGFDAIPGHPKGVGKWAIVGVSVIAGLPEHEPVDRVRDFLVRIVTTPFPGWL